MTNTAYVSYVYLGCTTYGSDRGINNGTFNITTDTGDNSSEIKIRLTKDECQRLEAQIIDIFMSRKQDISRIIKEADPTPAIPYSPTAKTISHEESKAKPEPYVESQAEPSSSTDVDDVYISDDDDDDANPIPF